MTVTAVERRDIRVKQILLPRLHRFRVCLRIRLLRRSRGTRYSRKSVQRRLLAERGCLLPLHGAKLIFKLSERELMDQGLRDYLLRHDEDSVPEALASA